MWEITEINKPITLYYATHWICSDGDAAELEINEEMKTIKIHCFSGISASFVLIDELDFVRFFKNENNDDDDDFWHQCYKIADYVCSLFCQSTS